MHSIRRYPPGQLGDAMALQDLREWVGEERWRGFYEYSIWLVFMHKPITNNARLLLCNLPQAFDMFAGVSGRPVRAYIRAMWSILK